jgi:hypothetical protein
MDTLLRPPLILVFRRGKCHFHSTRPVAIIADDFHIVMLGG